MDFLRSRMLKTQSLKAPEEEVAIQTLSNRLQHATLALDRRSAVLGLKSFSRQFRESVVQYGLRSLLATLAKDSDNAMMVKAILETLLILFLRGDKTEDEASGWIASQSRFQNGKYPSPLLMIDVEADQFSMWIADEVTLSDAHLQVLINILQDSQDYHIRLYTLQLFEFLVCTRPTRTKEVLINIPLAISTIVSLLNDVNDPVRNEAILVLMALANNNFNIQKLVAFENTFDKLFEIIEEEGGIRGSILVQDCLTLLTNLLMYNALNQKYFLETEGVPKLAKLLAEPIEETVEEGIYDENGNTRVAAPIIWTEQRLQNMSIALEICRAFVDEDDPEVHKNQDKLFQAGIFFCTMRLVFSPITENPIRKAALQITGDIIAGNFELQLQFSQIDVPYIDPSLPTQLQKFEKPIPAPVALLNWALLSNSVHIFEIRLASVYCLRCFFKDNTESKIAFLTDQARASQNPLYYEEMAQEQAQAEKGKEDGEANGHSEQQNLVSSEILDESTVKTPYANIFSTLMDFDFENKLNPYRVWFAATILVYLFEECPENRQQARELVVGNADEGEEVMLAIQAISGILTTTLDDQDPRIAVGLMILLTMWLYEDFDAVNDFLSDPLIVKTILAFLTKNSTESSDLVHGMSAILVGVAYEFCQKSSPISRSELHSLVTKALGANNYALKVKQFKECEEFLVFSDPLLTEVERDSTGLPKVFFISNYVDLIKDNYYRIRKALSHSPLVDPHIKISYELLEDLERKNSDLAMSLQELKELAEQNEANLKSQISSIEEDLKDLQQHLQRSLEESNQLKDIEKELTSKLETLASDLEHLESEKAKYEKNSEKYSSELNKISKQNHNNEGSLQQIKQKLQDTEAAKTKAEDGINKMSRELFQLTRQKKELETKIAKLEKEISQLKLYQQKANKDYESQVKSLKKSNEDLKTKIRSLELQLRESSTQRDRELLQLRDLQSRLSDAEAGSDNLMEKLRAAASVVQNLKRVNSEQSQQLESLKIELAINTRSAQEVQSQQIELNNLKAKNEALESAIASMKSSVDQNDESSQKSLFEAIESKAAHETKANALSKEVEILQSSLNKEKETHLQTRTSFDDLKQQLESKKSEVTKKDQDLEDQATQLRKLKADLDRLTLAEETFKRTILEKENDLAETTLSASALKSTLEEKVGGLEEELKVSQEKLDQANADYAQTKSDLEELHGKYSQLQEELANALAENEKHLEQRSAETDEARENLESQISELKVELLGKSDEITKITGDLKEAESKIGKLEEQSKKFTNELEKVNAELRTKEDEVAETKSALKSKIAELENLKADLSDELMKVKAQLSQELEYSKSQLSDTLERSSQHSDEDEKLKTYLTAELEKSKSGFASELESVKISHISELEEIKKAHSEKEAEIERTHLEQVKSIETQHSKSLTTFQDDLARAQQKHTAEVEELDALYKKVQADLVSRSEEHKSSVAEFDELTERHDKLSEELRKLQADSSNTEGEKESAQKEIEELNISITDLKKQLESVEKEKEELIDTKNELTDKIQSLETELVGHAEKEQTVISSVYTQNGSVDEGNVKDVLSREVASKIAELMAKDQLISEIKKKLEYSTTELEDLTERNTFLEDELKESNRHIQELESALIAIEEKLRVLEEDMKNAIKLNENLIEQLDEKSQELDQKIQESNLDQESHKEEIQSHKGVEKELAKQLQSLEKELKKRIADHETDRKKLTGGAEPLIEEYKEKITELESSLEDSKQEHNSALANIQEHKDNLFKLEQQLTTLRDEHETNLKTQKGEFELKITDLTLEIQLLQSRTKDLSFALETHETQKGEWSFTQKELEEAIEQLHSELAETKENVLKKEEKIRVLESELADSRGKLETTLEELNLSNERLKKVNKNIEKSSTSLESCRSRITELEAELTNAREVIHNSHGNLKLELQVANDLLTEKNLKVEGLQKQLETSKFEADELTKKVKQAESALRIEKKRTSELEGSIASLRFEKEKLEDELSGSEKVVVLKSNEISVLQEKLEDAVEQAKNAETKITDSAALNLEVTDLKSKIEKLELERQGFEGEKSALEKSLNDLQEISKKLQEKLEESEAGLKKSAGITPGDIKKLKNELSRSTSLKDTLEKENAKLKTRLDNNTSSKNQLETELRAISDELETLKSSENLLTKKIKHFELKAKESDELVIDLKTKLSDYMDERFELENTLAASKKELESLQTTLDDFKKEQKKLKAELDTSANSKVDPLKLQQEFQQKAGEYEKHIHALQGELNSKIQELGKLQKVYELESKDNKTTREIIKTLEAEIQKLKESQKSESQKIENVLRNTSSQNSILGKELREEKAKLQQSQAELQNSKSQLQKADSQVAHLGGQVSQLTSELSQIKHELSEARSTTLPAVNGAHNQELEKEIAQLKEQLSAKDKQQSDFDDLILLWEEQQEKLTKYKSQLVDLGQQVSSDEESDDDSE